MATVKMCDICKSIKDPILNYYLPKPISSPMYMHFQPKEYDLCQNCAAALCRFINDMEENKNNE